MISDKPFLKFLLFAASNISNSRTFLATVHAICVRVQIFKSILVGRWDFARRFLSVNFYETYIAFMVKNNNFERASMFALALLLALLHTTHSCTPTCSTTAETFLMLPTQSVLGYRHLVLSCHRLQWRAVCFSCLVRSSRPFLP